MSYLIRSADFLVALVEVWAAWSYLQGAEWAYSVVRWFCLYSCMVMPFVLAVMFFGKPDRFTPWRKVRIGFFMVKRMTVIGLLVVAGCFWMPAILTVVWILSIVSIAVEAAKLEHGSKKGGAAS